MKLTPSELQGIVKSSLLFCHKIDETSRDRKQTVIAHLHEFSYWNEHLSPVQQPGWSRTGMTRTGMTSSSMTFCGGIMLTNTEPQERSGMNSHRYESRPGIM